MHCEERTAVQLFWVKSMITSEPLVYVFICNVTKRLIYHAICTKGQTVDCVWNVMAHAQKPDFVFQRNGRVHLNRRGRQFSRLLAAEVWASAVVMLDTPCYEVVWRILAAQSIRQFPLHFPSSASPCAITLQMGSSTVSKCWTGKDFEGTGRCVIWSKNLGFVSKDWGKTWTPFRIANI
jgi:hypothetical protein